MKNIQRKKKTYLLSIHDIMPENFDKVLKLLEYLKENKIKSATCLVVPGCSWSGKQIEQLKYFQKNGFDLAGHGWHHRVYHKKNLYHRLHSLLISRNVAEHLSIDSEDIYNLMLNCSHWFDQNNLKTPYTYVPPAWAMGNIDWGDLLSLPYNCYETFTGLYHKGEFYRLPLVGYEVDNLFRIIVVKISNFLNESFSSIMDKPLRVSIHPNDFELGLNKDLRKILISDGDFVSYKDYFEGI